MPRTPAFVCLEHAPDKPEPDRPGDKGKPGQSKVAQPGRDLFVPLPMSTKLSRLALTTARPARLPDAGISRAAAELRLLRDLVATLRQQGQRKKPLSRAFTTPRNLAGVHS